MGKRSIANIMAHLYPFKATTDVSTFLPVRFSLHLVMAGEMVGTTGFEPATSRTPSVRATRLRYVPTGKLTATGQQIRRPNRRGNQHHQGITAVRAASRKRAAYRANRAASCGSATAPCLPPHGS